MHIGFLSNKHVNWVLPLNAMPAIIGTSVSEKNHSNLGFGLERIGIATLQHPYIATALLLLSLVLSALAVPNAKFDGNVVNVVNQHSKAVKDFKFQNEHYRNFAGDAWLIIKTPNLATAKTMEALRNLHLDLALEDGVGQVFSIFSLGDPSKGIVDFTPMVPETIESDEQAKQVLDKVITQLPSASAIVSPEKNAVMLVVSLAGKPPFTENQLSKILYGIKASAIELAPENYEIVLSGYPAIRMSIVEAIIADQMMLTLVGIAIGALVSLAIFGNFTSAIVCTLPPAIAIAWILAAFSLTGIKLNFLTTVLPTLALIIAFADSIVIYFRWQALNKSEGHSIANLQTAIWRVGPASSLTSITTALAFLSFIWADSATLTDFALFGLAAVVLSFLAVMIGLPVACYWSNRLLPGKKSSRGPAFASFGPFVANRVLVSPPTVIIASLLLLAGFSWIHLQLQPSYETSSNLPYNSEIRAAEEFSDEAFGGTSQYLIIVPVSANGRFDDLENRNRVKEIDALTANIFGERKTLSLAQVWASAKPDGISEIAQKIMETESDGGGRFIGNDKRTMMVVTQASSRENTKIVNQKVAKLKAAFAHLPYANEIRITGLPVLLASEFPPLIDQLRTGLLLAIILAVGVVGIAARSFSLAFATLVPNLLPLLFAEAAIWIMGTNLDITSIIALTIAFGISIDNAVHVINSYNSEKNNAGNNKQAPEVILKNSLKEIAPALLASTVIVCLAAIVTQFSTMPSVNNLGRLLVGTLLVALITNLVVLPSYIYILGRIKRAPLPDEIKEN